MGGNALREGLTRRFDASEYHELSPEILKLLNDAFPNRRAAIIASYREKESFGDIDILIASDDIKDVRESIERVFRPSEIIHNGTVWSFDYKAIQVDLIMTPDSKFDIGYEYFSNNDLGNLIGRIANKFGLSYGHDGLWMKVRDKMNVIGKILLTDDIKIIIPFLGYDYSVYEKGFDTIEEIFEFVVSSPFYSYDIFDFANRNSGSTIS